MQTDTTLIQGATLRDKRLSLETRGALAVILTYPKDIEMNAEILMNILGVGRVRFQRIIDELKRFGYLEIVQLRDEKGQAIDKEWMFYEESKGEVAT